MTGCGRGLEGCGAGFIGLRGPLSALGVVAPSTRGELLLILPVRSILRVVLERGFKLTIVCLTFLRITQHFVGCGDMLKPLLGRLVVGVHVGVVPSSEDAIGPPNLLRCGLRSYA
jgi:hypothetical protein